MKTATAIALVLLLPAAAFAQVRDLTSEPLPAPLPAGTQPAPTRTQDATSRPFKVNPRTVPGAHVQSAWDQADDAAGILEAHYSPVRTVRFLTREAMGSVVSIPPGDQIADYQLRDTVNFKIENVAEMKSKMWVWAINPGYDTSLIIIGKSGAEYPFYIRGEAWDSDKITHQVVRILGGDPATKASAKPPQPVGADTKGTTPATAEQQRSIQLLSQNMPPLGAEWVRKGCLYDPTRIRHDRQLLGDNPEVGPVWVYRDDCFTYADWGDKKRWAGVWRVNDGHEEPITFDKSLDGRFQIIHSTEPLIFKAGDRWACVQPVGPVKQ